VQDEDHSAVYWLEMTTEKVHGRRQMAAALNFELTGLKMKPWEVKTDVGFQLS
jgi:hypothetical protein